MFYILIPKPRLFKYFQARIRMGEMLSEAHLMESPKEGSLVLASRSATRFERAPNHMIPLIFQFPPEPASLANIVASLALKSNARWGGSYA